MKKIYTLLLLIAVSFVGFAQQPVTLTFTAKDATTNAFVELSRIEIVNITQQWRERLLYPDTVAVLNLSTGIEENGSNGGFCLSQNNPNPFNGATDVNLTVTESGPVTMEITDVNGQVVATFCKPFQETSLQYGTHQFRINIATHGIFVLTARQNGKTSSVKMVNNGNGTRNGIEYVGIVNAQNFAHQQTKSDTRYVIHRPFSIGDEMEYVGYTYVNGAEIGGSLVIRQQQFNSEEIVFNLIVPVANPNDGQPCENMPTLTDVDGNTYNTVQIGSQCWMKENLRTTKYADNTEITLVNEQTGYQSGYDVPYRYYPDNSLDNVNPYGYLYNWKAVMGNFSSSHSNPSDVQGICPNGWHIPSQAEWTQLADYVSSLSAYRCEDEPTRIDKALASTEGWYSTDLLCSPGNEPSSNNATGFSVLPAGYSFGADYQYFHFWSGGFGNQGRMWSATTAVTGVCIDNGCAYVSDVCNGPSCYPDGFDDKGDAFSVRCVRNN